MFDQALTLPQFEDFDWSLPPCISGRMYAVSFGLDAAKLRDFNLTMSRAYVEIKRVLRAHGFKWQIQSVLFGDPDRVNAGTCAIAAMDLAKALPWFEGAVRDLRMFRVEEQTSVMAVVRQASDSGPEGTCLAEAGAMPARKP